MYHKRVPKSLRLSHKKRSIFQKDNWNFRMSSAVSILGNSCTVGSAINNGRNMHQEFTITARVVAPKRPNLPELSLKGIPHTDLHVREIVQWQLHTLRKDHDICRKPDFHPKFLEDAYDRCRDICAEYAKTFYLGTLNSWFQDKKQYGLYMVKYMHEKL